MADLHIDDAIDFIVRHLGHKFQLIPGSPEASIQCAAHYDVEVRFVAAAYWSKQGKGVLNMTQQESAPYLRPFFDAAWCLCQIGVLRPGQNAPGSIGMRGPGFDGDGYALTAFGREWIASAGNRPPSDPSRFSEIMGRFAAKFGPGFLQRATEASSCYRSANYLACCAMAGSAAESILLALADAKIGDPEKVLKQYRASGGRREITKRILSNTTKALVDQFTAASHILHFWRDETAHGTHTTISEVEAHMSLGQLLRFAQLCADNWAALTAP
jgi:hypothetical protein